MGHWLPLTVSEHSTRNDFSFISTLMEWLLGPFLWLIRCDIVAVHLIYIAEWWQIFYFSRRYIIVNMHLFVSPNLLYIDQEFRSSMVLSETRGSCLKRKPRVSQELPITYWIYLSSLGWHARCIRTGILPTSSISSLFIHLLLLDVPAKSHCFCIPQHNKWGLSSCLHSPFPWNSSYTSSSHELFFILQHSAQ